MSTPANSEFDLIQDSSDVFTAATRSNESGASGCLWFLYLRRRHSPPQSPTIRHYRLRIEPPKSVRVSPRIGRFNLKWAGPSSSSSNTPITIQPVIVWSRGLRKISHSLISILSMNRDRDGDDGTVGPKGTLGHSHSPHQKSVIVSINYPVCHWTVCINLNSLPWLITVQHCIASHG